MNNSQCLSHAKWECKYHVVWIPKCRRKLLYGQLRKHLGEILRELARQKECKILEGHLQSDHVHMLSGTAYVYPSKISALAQQGKGIAG